MHTAVAAMLALSAGATDGGTAWGAEAFSAPVETLRAATSSRDATQEGGQTWLFRSVHWSVDVQHHVRRVTREIVRIDGADAVRAWSTITLHYVPGREAPPVIRARVVTPDGRVFKLTPEMVHEDVARDDELIVGDGRSVSAALPGVRSGAVVELELTFHTTTPLFLAAQAGRFVVGRRPIEEVEIVLEHPRTVPLALSFSHLALSRRDEDSGDLHRVRLRGEKVRSSGESSGHLAWTTATSWQAVSRAYQALLEPVRAAKTSVDVNALVKDAKTRREKAQRLLEWLSSEVRYTGLEFGERNIVPWSPAEVLRRGFGDCKDLALLLIDLLARAGIDARLALLDTDGGLDPDSPSLSFFDHAIVYVPPLRGEPAIWVDATANNVPAGMLPRSYAGELALVIDSQTTRLSPTWSPSSSDNHRTVELDVTLPDYGGAHVRVTQRLTGLNATWARDGIASEGSKWMTVELADLGELIGVSTLEPAEQPSLRSGEPFVYGGEANHVRMFYSEWDDAVLKLPEHVVFQWLPDRLTDDQPPARDEGELTFGVPHVATVTLRAHPPEAHVLTESPAAKETRMGPAVLRRSISRHDDGTVELTLRLDTGPRRYSRADVDAFRAAFAGWKKEPVAELRFAFEPSLLQKQGKVREVIAWYAARRAARGDSIGLAARYAGELLQLGLVDAARDRTRELVAANPGSALAWLARGWILTHDRFGNTFRPGFDRPGALAALRRALQLEPGCTYCVQQLAWLEGYDDDAGWLTPRVDPARAAAAWSTAWPNDRSSLRWVELMVFAERWTTLRESLGSPTTPEQRAAILLADQMVDGTDAAWNRWSARLSAADLKLAVTTVVAGHLRRGRAAEALALARLAGLETERQLARLIEALKRPPRLQPELQVMRDAMAAALAPDEATRERFAATSLVAVPGGQDPKRYFAQLSASMRRMSDGTPAATALALASLSLFDFRVDAIGSDRRVNAKADGFGSGDTYLVRVAGRWRLLVASTGRELAARAVELSSQKRAADARAWFEAARTRWNQEPANADTSLVRAVASAFPTDDELFAAALSPDLPASRLTLAAALGTAPAKVQPVILELLLAGAARAGAKEEAGKWVSQLEALQPDDAGTFEARLRERTLAGDLAGREAACQAWLAKHPGAVVPLAELATVAAQQGQFDVAARRWRDLAAMGAQQPGVYNSAAWDGLFTEQPPAELLEWAKKAGDAKDAPWAYRHTLATVLANDAKDLPRTLEVFRALASSPPSDAAWVVPARLAHRLGLRDEARALYQRIAKPGQHVQSTEALAVRWLAELERAEPPAVK